MPNYTIRVRKDAILTFEVEAKDRDSAEAKAEKRVRPDDEDLINWEVLSIESDDEEEEK